MKIYEIIVDAANGIAYIVHIKDAMGQATGEQR